MAELILQWQAMPEEGHVGMVCLILWAVASVWLTWVFLTPAKEASSRG